METGGPSYYIFLLIAFKSIEHIEGSEGEESECHLKFLVRPFLVHHPSQTQISLLVQYDVQGKTEW